MLFLMDCTKCTKIILGFFVLIYFGASLVICDEDIPFCKESLKELKKDLKDWQERCLNNALEYSRDINTPCCNAEKKNIQSRRKTHRKLCFYKGKHFIYMLQRIAEKFDMLLQMGGRFSTLNYETQQQTLNNQLKGTGWEFATKIYDKKMGTLL